MITVREAQDSARGKLRRHLATWATQLPVDDAGRDGSPLVTIALKPPTEKEMLTDERGTEAWARAWRAFLVLALGMVHHKIPSSSRRTSAPDMPQCSTPRVQVQRYRSKLSSTMAVKFGSHRISAPTSSRVSTRFDGPTGTPP